MHSRTSPLYMRHPTWFHELKSNTRSYTIHIWQLNSPREPILLGIYPIQFEMSSTEDMVKWGDHCTMELAQKGLIHLQNDEMGLLVWATGPSSSWSPKNMSSLVQWNGPGSLCPAGLVPPKNMSSLVGWTCQAWYSETPFHQVVMDFRQACSPSGELEKPRSVDSHK